MVIVNRKFNREMPVGSMVTDIEYPEFDPVHVKAGPRTTRLGTEMTFVTDSGQWFSDLAKYYRPFV